jgi:hypothetical protein
MRKTLFVLMLVGILSTAIAAPALAGLHGPNPGETQGRAGTTLEVTVLGSGLTYSSIVTADLPANGRFQQLIPTPAGLTTAYGPGDVGYLGGRWWVDVNGDGEMNDGDAFFLCPLLGPGQ